MSRLKTECFLVKMAMVFFYIIISTTRACEFANPRAGSQLKIKQREITKMEASSCIQFISLFYKMTNENIDLSNRLAPPLSN